MRIAGIIAEYTPLHNGHLRLFQKVREELSEQTPIVVIMSGAFVQRGIPSLTDRESRVCALLCNGADLVFELPFTFATGSADRFAHGGVSSLLQSGVITDLYFGAEHPSLSDLSLIAEKDFESDPVFSEKLEQLQKDGLPYAAAWQEAANSVIGGLPEGSFPLSEEEFGSIIRKPNNILAISYLRELHRAGSSVVPHLVCREGSFHEEELSEGDFPSATAIERPFPKTIKTSQRAISSVPSEIFSLMFRKKCLPRCCIFGTAIRSRWAKRTCFPTVFRSFAARLPSSFLWSRIWARSLPDT